MPYQITGTLKLPDGTPASNVDIEFVPLVSVSPVIRDLSNVIRTSSSGAYSMQLQYGEYSVKLTPVFGYQISAGRVSVDRDTQAGMDLPTLLALYDESSTAPSYAKQIAQWLAEAKASAAAAKVSETNAKASEVAAKSSETNAKSSETKAKASEVATEADRAEVAANTALVASAQADVASKHADVLSAASQVATDKLAVAEDAAESAASSLIAVT
ncbi:MAG: prophage tail fiber N-terminal domain-containing protein, partial [Hafnia sp.]